MSEEGISLPAWLRSIAVILFVAGSTAGCWPFLAYAGSGLLVKLVVPLLFLTALIYQTRVPARIARLPTFGELGAALLVSAFPLTVFCGLQLLVLMVLWGAAWGLDWVVGLLGADLGVAGSTVGLWGAIALYLMVPAFAAIAIRQAGRLVYPQDASPPRLLSRLREANKATLLWMAGGTLVVLILATAFGWFRLPITLWDAWASVFLLAVVITPVRQMLDLEEWQRKAEERRHESARKMEATQSRRLGRSGEPSAEPTESIWLHSVALLLEQIGYEIELREDSNPVTASCELVARGADDALGVKVVTGEAKGDPLGLLGAGIGLVHAARTLSAVSERPPLRPVLVVIDSEQVSKREKHDDFDLVRLTPESLSEAIGAQADSAAESLSELGSAVRALFEPSEGT